ncbi:zinc ribbon domain-containing protein [Epilithonimonas hispanica]|uniref:Recombinase zinc beta ribbon domain-containing protein n=1 Tax=Epilithonimonas hispanica TaxID=358687 RepID=A0A3D9CW45_9FLAO|nr:zinc ribbon domain-containing protein [Epilithonimonas hispanica]REC69954.1 hypothetical protein DRF58_11205 [Epilithonimonas hispanica]
MAERPKGKIIAANEFPLRGFLKCPQCGRHISGSGSKGKKNVYYYYHCNSKCGYRHSSNKVNSAFEKELEKYDYNESMNSLIKEIILRNFKSIQENIDSKKKEFSIQIANLINRLDSAREKYLEDKLDFEDYQIIKNESKKRIDELEMELQNQKLSRKNLDIKAKLDQVLDILPNLSKLYLKGDNETKSSILCSILAEKLEFEETTFRTPKLNSTLAQIVLINNQLRSKKKKKRKHF